MLGHRGELMPHRQNLMIIWLLLVFVAKKTVEVVQDLLLGLHLRNLVPTLRVTAMSSSAGHVEKIITDHHGLN